MNKLKSINNLLHKLHRSISDGSHSLKDSLSKKCVSLVSKYGSRPRGIVELDVIDAVTGARIGGFKEENVIVDLARANMSKLFVGDNTASRVIGSVKFSDGGHNPTTNEPLVPTVGDTGLANATVIEKTIASGDVVITHPDDYSTKFQITIENNEGNGSGFQTYSELGLFTIGGTMFSRKTFGAQTKSSGIRLIITYTVIF